MIRTLSLLLCLLCSTVSLAANKILVLGDSLSAGYNMPIEKAWPSLLTEAMATHGQAVNVINASISGDTTGNGLARLPELLKNHQPDWVIIELGANDGLRGFPPKVIETNLTKLITLSQDANANVALMQIRVPPNYGKRYSDMFAKIYPQLATRHNTVLMPFFLEEIILKPEWMMDDGLHPEPEAQPWIAQFVSQNLAKHLEN
ncbi:multifunctional acyl-CoA thioesterase I/protease I/lysophospholipase L1 [Vibrio sp. SM6]|uniref:Multifunctional acyl-CoA thioesterase I/protease I/lysophospholipase L1 n=1 Tax=Vibrio agarilyticus TaxID=2726741 RepID=A0A7X8TR57_9VIBR|nr:multifunctional acyl-CoA thioesterase I/protease I/lysophospholipase L1 [Vibrio agarilyticus]NLS13323.1 multifunctional acyl-CoA thioesterase I/protease I/lysophospholipase L1 [Vibrio agarilyticus]